MYHREDIAKYLERGRMDPVFKKEDPLEKTNYRPITVLTVVDKIFEQLQSKQMPKNLKRFLTSSCQRTVKCTAVRPHWFVWSKTRNMQLTSVNLSAYYQLI